MDVQLYVYDLSGGMARSMSMPLLGTQIDAIYHTSIVFNGIEYFFGQGIQQSRPGATHHGRPIEIIPLGQTQLPPDVVLEYLDSLKATWTAESYDLFQNNCNNFSNELAMFLVGKGIPDHITSLPETVLNTPFGQMLKPRLTEAMRPITQAPPAASKAPPPAMSSPNGSTTAAAAAAAVTEHGQVYNITDPATLDRLLAQAKSTCATIFFTSSTCAPCRLAYPTFDSLAEQHPKATFIKIDLNRAHDVGARYQVRATPTFMTFHHGAKQDEWSGADPSRLRATVDALLRQTFPPHPHAALAVPAIRTASLRPVVFAKIPPLDKLLAKLGDPPPPAAAAMRAFVAARAASPNAPPPLPDLVPWATYIRSSLTTLSPDALFPALDLLRCALLDPRVAAFFAAEPPATLLAIFEHMTALTTSSTCPYPLRLVALQLACALFAPSAPPLPAALAAPLAALAANSLLADASRPALRSAACSLAFDMAALNYRVRREEGREAVPAGAQIEVVAALLEMLGAEGVEMAEGAAGHVALVALGLCVYFAEVGGEVLDLCAALGAREVVGALVVGGRVEGVRADLVKLLPPGA